MRQIARQRFIAKTAIDENGCHVWVGALDPTGYGRFHLDGRMVYAHRIAYQWVHGLIPAGFDLDHLCRNRRCVNPAHLEAVTRRTNLLRSPFTLTTAHKEGRDCGFTGCKNCSRFHTSSLTLSVQPMPGPNVAHAGHTAPATGGTGRGDRLKGDATVACTDTSTTNATEPGHHRAHVA